MRRNPRQRSVSAASARLCGRPLKLFASQLQVVTVCAQHRQRVRVANRVACGMHSGRGCVRRTMNSVKRGVAQQRKASRCYQPRQRARRHRSGKRRAKSQQCVCVELQRREAAGAFVLSCAQPGWTGGCKVRATATSSEASKQPKTVAPSSRLRPLRGMQAHGLPAATQRCELLRRNALQSQAGACRAGVRTRSRRTATRVRSQAGSSNVAETLTTLDAVLVRIRRLLVSQPR